MRLLAATGVLLLPARSSALDPTLRVTQYAHRSWGSAEGLPQNSVNAIAQTPDGYLWIGTQEGLVRFDGVRFTVYDRHNAPALSKNFVNALLVDRQGRLWIGLRGGGVASYAGGRFRHYGRSDGLEGEVVFSIHEARDGTLWVGTATALNRLEPDGRFTPFGAAQGLPRAAVQAIADDPLGGLWIGTDGGGLLHYDGRRISRFAGKLASDTVMALLVDRQGSLWIGTRGGGLDHLHGGTFEVISTRQLGSDEVRSLWEDRDGSLWVGTVGAGVARRTPSGAWERLPPDPSQKNAAVYSFFEDREGSLWFGALAGGLNQLRDSKLVPFGVPEGLASDGVWAILPAHDGSVLIGTSRGVSRLRAGKITSWRGPNGPLVANVIALEQDPSGALWVGTTNGLQRWREGRPPEDISARLGLGHAGITALLLEPSGKLWISSRRAGIVALQAGTAHRYGLEPGMTGELVLMLREDRAGTLWIGTTRGLFRWTGEHFVPFASRDLSGAGVFDMYEDARGVFWLATDDGLKRIENGRVFSFTSAQGFPDADLFRVLEDDRGGLWTSGNLGLTRWNKADLERFAAGEKVRPAFEHYGLSDGMRSAECNGGSDPAGARTPDGKLWFPTSQGAVRVDPANLKADPLPPPVVIEQVIADQASIDPSRRGILAPGTRKLEIHYSGLSFRSPDQVRFKYRLDGFDEEWIDAGSRRVAYYTGLPPGQYRFEVLAANADGVWSPKPATFSFEARPLFRQTGWFDALWILVALILAGVVFGARMRTMQRRERELLLRVAERDEFISLASHELRTPLAALQLAVTAARRGVAGPQGLSLIQRQTSRLSELVEKLLELALITREGVTLQREDVDLVALVRKVVEERREELERAGSTLRLKAPPALVGRWDRRGLEHVIRQLLSNAIRHGEGLPVDVTVEQEPERARLTVRDHGPGVPPELRGHVFERIPPPSAPKAGGLGVGLWTSLQLVEAMGGGLHLGPDGGGATFIVDLPLRADEAQPPAGSA